MSGVVLSLVTECLSAVRMPEAVWWGMMASPALQQSVLRWPWRWRTDGTGRELDMRNPECFGKLLS